MLDGGEGGIRTPEPLRANGFQDRRIQPLCHLSALKKTGAGAAYENSRYNPIAAAIIAIASTNAKTTNNCVLSIGASSG